MTPATAIGYLEWMRREPDIKPEFDEALRTAIQALKASAVNPVKARYDARVGDLILSDECAEIYSPERIKELAEKEKLDRAIAELILFGDFLERREDEK